MASRKIEDLHPDVIQKYHSFMQGCKEQGIDVIITCTYRSCEEQTLLYAQGRTVAGKIVTNAKTGESKHNNTINGKPASKAFDIVPIVNGKCIWDSKHPIWQELGKIGRRCGLEWAGDWKGSLVEYPHFQIK